MSSIAGVKKTKRHFRDLFKSRDSKSTSIRGTNVEQNESSVIPSGSQPNSDEIASQATHQLNTRNHGVRPSPLAHSSVSITGSDATSSLVVSSGLGADIKGSSSSEKKSEKGPDEEGLGAVASMAAQLNITSGLGIAGRFVQTALKKLPDCVDSNPVKMALSIFKTIIDIKDEIGDNKDMLTNNLQSTRLLLSDAIGKVELDDSEDVKREIEEYKRKIDEQNTQLVQITQELESVLRHLDYENYKERITKICKTIDEITMMFMLSMQIEIRKTTAKMHEQMKEEKQARQEEQKERRTMSLQDLNPARKADHKTVLEGQTLKRETCTEGTRTKILEDIANWANDGAADSPHVFWLTGQAGSGKTTIAYTIAKLFEKGQCAVLGANFLCSRQFDETRSLNRIIPTIAFQLAGKCGPYEAALHAHVKDKSAMVDRDIAEQMQEFLVKPWSDAEFPEHPATHLIVIDALDELNEDGGSKFLSLLLTTIDRHDLHNVKFFVTSRTDPVIVQLCDTFNSKTVCRLQDVPIEDAEADVKRYLDTKLPSLVGSPELVELGSRASGLFIYAVTAFRILTTPRSITPKEQARRLGDLLSKPSSLSTVGKDKSPIDGLYKQILYDAFSDFANEEYLTPRLNILFTYLCAAERISPSVAAALMDDDEELAVSVLNDLHAVLYIQDGRVFWYHASFPDFLLEKNRSTFRLDNEDLSFWCNKGVHHTLLALSCFRIMASKTRGLKFNIGGITSSYFLDSECVDEISQNLNVNISPTLRYSSFYWGAHLSSSTPFNSDIDYVGICISDFLQIRVLFWIEAMNLLKANDQYVLNLHQARGWVMNAGFLPATQAALEHDLLETGNFATYFVSSPASESTPHLYISSLATWKSTSSLSKHWRNQFSSASLLTYGNIGYDVPLLTIDFNERVGAVAFSGDGTWIVVGLGDNSVQIMDASTGKMSKVLIGHTAFVSSICFSHDDTWIASSSWDNTIRIWDSVTGDCLKVLTGQTWSWRYSDKVIPLDRFQAITVSKHDLWIASASEWFVKLWDISTGDVLLNIPDSINASSVSFSMDSTRIAFGSNDHSVQVWDVLNGQELIVMRGHTGYINSVAYTIDGARIVSASNDATVCIWNAVTGEQQARLWGHRAAVMSVAVSSSIYMVSGSDDQSVRIWNIITGKTLKVLKGHNRGVYSVALSSDPIRIVSGAGDVRMWNLWDVLKEANVDEADDDTSPVTSVGFSRDDKQILYGSDNGSVHVWNLSTHQELRVLKHSTEPVSVVAFSSDGSRFGWVSKAKMWVWDISRNAAEMVVDFYKTGPIRSVFFSKDEKLLVLASNRHIVQLWDESTDLQSQFAELAPAQYVISLSHSQDGQKIVSGSKDGAVRVWDVSSEEIINTWKCQCDWVRSVAFSDDASLIVSGSNDQTVRVWDALTGEMKVIRGHKKRVNTVAFTSDNAHVVSRSTDSTVRVWDVHTGKEVYKLRGRHTGAVSSIAVSGDSKSVISGAQDGSVIIWDLEEPSWYLANTNWILSSATNSRLMWVPPEVQVLQRPNCRILVSESLYTTFDHERAMLAIGPGWEKCYTPNTSSAP